MFSPEMMKTAQSMMANMSPEVPLGGLRNQRGEDFWNKTFGSEKDIATERNKTKMTLN